jgi:hypothetical protein
MEVVETILWRQYPTEPAAGGRPPLRLMVVQAGLRAVGSRLLLIVAVLFAGCGQPPEPSNELRSSEATGTRPSVALRVLVVNDESVAEAIDRLRGEWAERSGGTLAAQAKPWSEVAAANDIGADVIVFQSRYTGVLCVRDWLRPVRPNVLESPEFDAGDIFPFVRHVLIRWGGQTMALPLGVDLVTVDEPVDRRPAVAFLAFAAPQVVSRDRIGVLFDVQSMKPRITEPGFVEALRELAESAMDRDNHPSIDRNHVDAPLPVLGYGDRLIAVTTSSRNAASGFKLAAWLASAEISSQLARAAGGMLPVRRSLASSPEWYTANRTSAELATRGKALRAALSGQQGLIIPRIPGIDDYLAALDEAVADAVVNGVEPQEALNHAAAEWERITSTHNRDAQHRAYMNHLGISNP